MLRLKNPHTVMAVLDRRPAAVKAVEVAGGRPSGPWQEVVSRAGECGVAVTNQRGAPPARRRGQKTERTGGTQALVEPPSPVDLNRLLPSEGNASGLWLALDQVQDPQNLGAIFRLAGFFGVQGIVMTRDRSAPITETVCDVSAGGVEYVPFAQVANLAQAMKLVQEAGIWVVGTCERASVSIRDIPRDRHWMLVLGNEGDGLRRLTRDKCDELCALPAAGPVPSLNVATAAAACLTVLSTPAGLGSS